MKIRAIAVLVLLLAGALLTGFTLLWSLFVFASAALVISFAWTMFGVRGIDGNVEEIEGHPQAGGWFSEKTTIVNNSRTPRLLVNVEESSGLPGHENSAVVNIRPGGLSTWRTDVYCRRRGRYSLGNLRATVTDPFGFFSSGRSFGQKREVLVHPATLELPLFQVMSRTGPGHGPNLWLSSEQGPGAARVREYVVGDTLKRIHWHSTAHAGKLMVKEFDAEHSSFATKSIWILPDMNSAAQTEEDDESTEETIITTAASLVKKYLDNEKNVGLLAAGDAIAQFAARTGTQHYHDIMDALTFLKAKGEISLDRFITSKIDLFDSSPVVIVITPSWNDRLTNVLRQLRSRGALVVVIAIDFGNKGKSSRSIRNLITAGFQVYTVRRGDDLARALDSRAFIPPARSIRE